jgi:hypothetical protein
MALDGDGDPPPWDPSAGPWPSDRRATGREPVVMRQNGRTFLVPLGEYVGWLSSRTPDRPDGFVWEHISLASVEAEPRRSIYIHLDPGTRELLYVGVAGSDARPLDFQARRPRHAARLKRLLAAGWQRSQIARIAATDIARANALRIEAELIRELRPIFNIQHTATREDASHA